MPPTNPQVMREQPTTTTTEDDDCKVVTTQGNESMARKVAAPIQATPIQVFLSLMGALSPKPLSPKDGGDGGGGGAADGGGASGGAGGGGTGGGGEYKSSLQRIIESVRTVEAVDMNADVIHVKLNCPSPLASAGGGVKGGGVKRSARPRATKAVTSGVKAQPSARSVRRPRSTCQRRAACVGLTATATRMHARCRTHVGQAASRHLSAQQL